MASKKMLVDFMHENMLRAISHSRERLNLLKRDARKVSKMTGEEGLLFKIFVGSRWTDEDGQHVTYQNRTPLQLDEAIKRAIIKAEKVNGSEPIYLDRFDVTIISPSGRYRLSLPKEFWQVLAVEWAQKYGKYRSSS